MAKKFYPIIRRMKLDISTPGGGSNRRYIQCNRVLSHANQRMYRQGRVYKAKVEVDVSSLNAPVKVYALRSSWPIIKAYQMAYHAYRNNTADERAVLAKGQMARWEDFTVATGISGDEMHLILADTSGGASLPVRSGAYALSEVVATDQSVKTFTWGPSSASSYNIIDEYDLAGNAQASPDSDTNDGPYANLYNEMDQQILQNLQEDGALPPYDQSTMRGQDPFIEVAELGKGTGNGTQKLSSGFFDAPCGLILIVGVDNDQDFTVEIQAGDYKGVNAPSMLE
jgi:hypothetical protein